MTSGLSNDHWIETYKSLIRISLEGFKFSALINGGAAIALLAYLGNIAGKNIATPDMRIPMAAFLTGLALCGLSMLIAYLTQWKLLNEIGETDKSHFTHGWFLWTAIILFLLSLVAFGSGSWQAVVRF